MAYQHPLAYLLGIEGLALLRAWVGDHDREFVEARLAEVRQLLANEALTQHPGVPTGTADVHTGYAQWAPTYDEPNSLFEYDEPVVFEILDGLPTGVVLDAACGTGRYAAHAAARGHTVIGVDSSADMLDRARTRLSEVDFRLGDLQALPVADGCVDTVLCGLALTHVRELAPVLGEFARVLRPGGHLVVADVHPELVLAGSVVHARGPAGEPELVATYSHTTGDYLRAALPHGFQVRRCEEPLSKTRTPPGPAAPDADPGTWDDWPWSLMAMLSEATRAALGPTTLICHFQLAEPGHHDHGPSRSRP